jgi:hypothetical protein
MASCAACFRPASQAHTTAPSRPQRRSEPAPRRGRADRGYRHWPCARLWCLAERPFSAPLSRARHERRRASAAGLRRCDEPRRRCRQGVRQPPLWHAGTHRNPARGPALPGELVPLRQCDHDRSVLAADRSDPPGRSDRPLGHRDQQLDRVLAKGRLAGSHRPGRPQRRCRVSRSPAVPTRSFRRSTGSTRRRGSTMSMARGSARSIATATRSPASACRRSQCRSAPGKSAKRPAIRGRLPRPLPITTG